MYDTVGFFSKIKGYYVNGDYYAKRILEMFKIDNQESFGNKAISVLKGEINIKNLSFGYDNKPILNNINLQIKPNTLISPKLCVASAWITPIYLHFCSIIANF